MPHKQLDTDVHNVRIIHFDCNIYIYMYIINIYKNNILPKKKENKYINYN